MPWLAVTLEIDAAAAEALSEALLEADAAERLAALAGGGPGA